MEITGTYTGSGTVQTTVRVRQGLAGHMYDTIDSSLKNSIDMTKQRYQDEYDMYQHDIDNEEKRIAQVQAAYEAEYAQLEQTLTLLQLQFGAITGTATSSSSSSSSSSSGSSSSSS